jgi:hypothetical protein
VTGGFSRRAQLHVVLLHSDPYAQACVPQITDYGYTTVIQNVSALIPYPPPPKKRNLNLVWKVTGVPLSYSFPAPSYRHNKM